MGASPDTNSAPPETRHDGEELTPEMIEAMRPKRPWPLIIALVVFLAGFAVTFAVNLNHIRPVPGHSISTEVLSGLGAIRAAERKIHAKTGKYVAVSPGDLGNAPDATPPGLGLSPGNWPDIPPTGWSVRVDPTYGFIARCDATVPRGTKRRHPKLIAEIRASGEARYSYDGGQRWSAWE